jgi:hypothetical protein
MNDNETFWMVWCPERQMPSKRHPTQAEAIAEATRIAQKEKKPVYVLMSIGQAVPQDPPVTWTYSALPTHPEKEFVVGQYAEKQKQADKKPLDHISVSW